MSLMSIGTSSLTAAQLGLLTTEHNIANASTPGYNRQYLIQKSQPAILTGSGYIGQGVLVTNVQRYYNEVLVGQVSSAQTSVSELETYYAQIKQIDNMLADQNSGLSPALQDFFSGMQQVAANPSSLPARQAVISSAQALISRYQSIETRLSEIDEGVGSQIVTTVDTINSYAQQIANLNQRIVIAQAATSSPPNDLLDQRDQVIADLNKLVRVRTSTNGDDSLNVFVGTGQSLVVGTKVNELKAIASSTDLTRMVVGMKVGNSVMELPEDLITGGSLGGLLTFRSETLDLARNELGRVAASMALTLNAQNGLGQDLLGQIVGDTAFESDLFEISAPKALSNSGNTGTASVTASFVNPPPAQGVYVADGSTGLVTRLSDGTSWAFGSVPASEGLDLTNLSVGGGETTVLRNSSADYSSYFTNLSNSDYRLNYDGTTYTLTRLSDDVSWADTDPAALSTTVANSEGFNFSISAGIAAGDSFMIQPTREVARNIKLNVAVAADPRLVAAAMPMRTAAGTGNTGTASISSGNTVYGFTSASIPTGGITLTYTAGSPNTFSLSAGLPAGANVSVTSGSTTTVYPATGAIPYTSGAQISFAGLSFTISGVPNTNDTFTISPNTAGVSDGRNALALGKLQTQNTVAGGTASYQSAYARLVSDSGNKSREIQVTTDAQQALLKQAQDSRDSVSGVNLDEEAANLIRYQQAFQASSKILDIAQKMFESILGIR